MIRELVCYRCTCSKCGHSWNTKTHDLPWNCAKCKSRLWNDDYVPTSEPEPIKTPVSTPNVSNDVLAFIQKAQAKKGIVEPVSVEPEPIDEWAGWSEERQAPDEQAGETVTYREHLKTRKRREIRRESAWQ